MIDIKDFIPVWVTVDSDARYRDHPKDFSKTRFLRYDIGGPGEKHTLSFAGNGSMEPQIWDIGELSSLRALLCSDWVDLNNAYAFDTICHRAAVAACQRMVHRTLEYFKHIL